jgi:hypothetical protein
MTKSVEKVFPDKFPQGTRRWMPGPCLRCQDEPVTKCPDTEEKLCVDPTDQGLIESSSFNKDVAAHRCARGRDFRCSIGRIGVCLEGLIDNGIVDAGDLLCYLMLEL